MEIFSVDFVSHPQAVRMKHPSHFVTNWNYRTVVLLIPGSEEPPLRWLPSKARRV